MNGRERSGVTRLLHQGINCHYLTLFFSDKTTHRAERGGSDRSRGGGNVTWVLSVSLGGHIRSHVRADLPSVILVSGADS